MLEFRAEPRPFAAAVGWVAKHVPNRPTIPIMAGILLEVANGTLAVTSFDYDVAAHAELDVTGDTPGRALVPGRLLANLAQTFPDKPVAVSIQDMRATIRCGSIRLTLPCLPDADYPTPPPMPDQIGVIPAGDFAAAVERVGVAADRDLSAAIKALFGIHITFHASHIQLLASDRYRAATARTEWKPAEPRDAVEVLVPAPALLDVAKTFDGLHDLTIGAEGGLVGFRAGDRTLVVRTLADEFPVHMRDLFPVRSDTPATVQVADLVAALKRADLVRALKSAAELTFSRDGLTVRAFGEQDAEAGEVLDCDYVGPDATVGVNPQYLAEAVAALRSPVAEISTTTASKPILLTAPEDGQNYAHMFVPIVKR